MQWRTKKLMDAQNRPESVCVRFFHVASISKEDKKLPTAQHQEAFALLVDIGSNPPHCS